MAPKPPKPPAAPKAPTAAQLKALKESKGVKSKETVKPASPAMVKKVNVQAELVKSRNEAARGYNQAGKVVLGGAILGKGAVSAIQNTYVLGKKVVHGSPTPNLKTIRPTTGSAARPNESVAYAWNPSKFRDKSSIEPMVKEYSNKNGTGGSVYIAKIKRSDIIKADPKETPPVYVVSKGKMKVTKEIKVKADTNVGKEIKKSFPGRDTTKVKSKLDQRKIKKLQKPNKTLDIA